LYFVNIFLYNTCWQVLYLEGLGLVQIWWTIKKLQLPGIPPHPFTCTLIQCTLFVPQLEGNISWSTLILVKICGIKTGCTMKTNGYLIFNYSNLDVYEPQCSRFLPFVITYFNATVFTFCGWFELNGMTPHGWQIGFTKCPAIVQATLGAVKKCLSFSKVDCCHIL